MESPQSLTEEAFGSTHVDSAESSQKDGYAQVNTERVLGGWGDANT